MQKMTRVSVLMFFISAFVSACGSGGSSDAANAGPEDYQYKGAVDPLTNTPGADRAGDLAARFDKIQGRM